jgi:UDP-N-acetylmuramate dehydrogenase
VNEERVQELRGRFGERVTFDVSLARFTTFRIGGPAAALLDPRHAEDVSAALQMCESLGIPWLALGLGSNVLLPDDGFAGLVIRPGKGLAATTREGPEDTMWTVGAGLPTPLLAKRSAAAGLGGVNRLIGVPGTVGGGVFMNAGAHGQEFRDVVRWVDIVSPTGSLTRVDTANIDWRYRGSGLEGIVVATQIALEPEDPASLQAALRRHIEWRRAGTPFDQPCCGSVFRNPDPDIVPEAHIDGRLTAGKLIDAAGLKGFRIGGAEVSTMHGNYIVNTGGATAADVLAVIEAVRAAVLERFDVTLRLEVKLIDPGERGGPDD